MTPPPVYKAIIKTLVRLSVFQISWSGSFRHIIHTSFFLLNLKSKQNLVLCLWLNQYKIQKFKHQSELMYNYKFILSSNANLSLHCYLVVEYLCVYVSISLYVCMSLCVCMCAGAYSGEDHPSKV